VCVFFLNFSASSYQNEFVTKGCETVTFTDQVFLQYDENSTQVSKLFNNHS